MGKPNAPCKDCEKRKHRCHSMCIEYAAFLCDVEEYRKTTFENKKKTYMAESVSVARSDRANKIIKRLKGR